MMRLPLMMIALTAGILSGPISAQDIDSMQTSEAYWAKLVEQRLERQIRLDELMGTMAEEMAVIRKTADPKRREEFMVMHRTQMREAMRLIRGMGGKRMREVMAEHVSAGMQQEMESHEPGHISNRMTSPYPRAEMSDAQRLADIENRLDMMQVMMESMLEADQTR